MTIEEKIQKLVSYGLSESQAIELLMISDEKELSAILNFLHFYYEDIVHQ